MAELKHKKTDHSCEAFKKSLRELRRIKHAGATKNKPYDPKQYDQKYLEG